MPAADFGSMLHGVDTRSPSRALLMCLVTVCLIGLIGTPTHAKRPSQPALKVVTSIESIRAPWPGSTLMLAWIDGEGGRLYPLPLLDRHGVITDTRAGRQVAATWSPRTGTATLLAVPSALTVRPSDAEPDGWRAIEAPETQSRWLPGKPLAISGPSKEQLYPIPETALMPLRLARRLAPRARVVTSDAPPASLNSAWQRTRHRDLIPTLETRLTVILAREDATSYRFGALPRYGLTLTTIGLIKALVVRAHGVTRAFMAPHAPTVALAHDPWTGSPWLWTEGIGAWDGLTGRRLDNGQAATQALTVVELSEAAFKAHWPGGTIHPPQGDLNGKPAPHHSAGREGIARP